MAEFKQRISLKGAEQIVTVASLAAVIEAELKEYFYDGISPTLRQYEIDRIIGGILQRVFDCPPLEGTSKNPAKSG